MISRRQVASYSGVLANQGTLSRTAAIIRGLSRRMGGSRNNEYHVETISTLQILLGIPDTLLHLSVNVGRVR